MRKVSGIIQLSATDLSNFLACHHVTELDKKVVNKILEKPDWNNPHAKMLQERGIQHETDYVTFVEKSGGAVTRISEDVSPEEAHRLTIEAIKRGDDYIVQGVLKEEEWFGKLDILRKVSGKSNLGDYHYEVLDTKLSRETKAGAILQLCLYSELLENVTGRMPEFLYVVTPGEPFNENQFRTSDYLSYYRLIKVNLMGAMGSDEPTYPDPVSSCDYCKWFETCDKKRRDDDHLSFVAGLTCNHQKELNEVGIQTLEDLAKANDDFIGKLETKNPESFIRIKEQARLQLDARESGVPKVELLDIEPERGLARLPEPSPYDMFFDIEGDKFFKNAGIEYLWGFTTKDGDGLKYEYRWALDFKEEKECFEWFIDQVVEFKKKDPNLKIYHYSSYEPAALKRLMGRYGTRESELDNLLRTETFVDLFSVMRQSLRAGIERYSIKDLEQFYKFNRKIDLRGLGPHKRLIEHSLELDKKEDITDEAKEIVRQYNQDDTDSTFYLREWLESLRYQLLKEGKDIPRPPESTGEVSDELDEYLQKLEDLKNALQDGISPVPEDRNSNEQAQWLLGDLVGFYRREDKANFWEKFRLLKLDALELLEDKSGLSGLTYISNIGGTDRCPIQRYTFLPQDIDMKRGGKVFKEGFLKDEEVKDFGEIVDIDFENSFVDIKKRSGKGDFHPNAMWSWNHISKDTKADRLFEMATHVLENGIENVAPKYKAAREILLRENPDLTKDVDRNGQDVLSQAKEFAVSLNNSYLATQGPPGTGKSYSGSRIILELVKKGYKVGVTGLSHPVICNLLAKVAEASEEDGISVNIYQKTKPELKIREDITYLDRKPDILRVLEGSGAFVFGGTDFMWSTPEYEDMLDYLVVDEAGQFSLVSIMSIAHATKNIILLGDGAQLKQPIKGSHPDGCEVSALDHIVGEDITLPEEKGIFLPETYRLHPKICSFVSELFYENRLNAIDGNEVQLIKGNVALEEISLGLKEISHWGNTNYSTEEIEALSALIKQLVEGGYKYTLNTKDGPVTKDVDIESIMVVAPYNAQVNRIKQAIPEVKVGTVDKFQGQEAPIVIYSVTTSSPEDAPRGMEFLYSGNRLNVAVSRAQCLFIMIASPKIFEPNCKNPRQMQLANAYCRFKELAEPIK